MWAPPPRCRTPSTTPPACGYASCRSASRICCRRRLALTLVVMPVPCRASTSLCRPSKRDVDGRDERGHDERTGLRHVDRLTQPLGELGFAVGLVEDDGAARQAALLRQRLQRVAR